PRRTTRPMAASNPTTSTTASIRRHTGSSNTTTRRRRRGVRSDDEIMEAVQQRMRGMAHTAGPMGYEEVYGFTPEEVERAMEYQSRRMVSGKYLANQPHDR